MWVGFTMLLALAGLAGTVLAARSLSHTDAQESHQAFRQTSSQVASALRVALAREQDLVVSAGVFELENPNASDADLSRWARETNVFKRHPELAGVATIAFVPRARLPAFAARYLVDPADPLRTLPTVPAGVRPYYCLVKREQAPAGPSRANMGVDYCVVDPQLIKSRTSGHGYDRAVGFSTFRHRPLLGIETPLYRGGGAVPATAAARRAAFLGWTGLVVLPEVLLNSALQGHPGIAVALRDTNGPHVLAFTAGRAPHGAARMAINLHNGSTLETYAAVRSAGLFANGNARALLAAGLLFSLTLFLLGLVLLTGRWRALRLVFEKTEQLSFQAMHDGLTDLPNRALVLDRAELMLARARRHNTPIATMFVDVDGFKQVNDTFGHSAGDQFLQTIAKRLTAVVRESDTVGRLGGDEFVVLVEGESLAAGPELVAERLLAVLRQPFELDSQGRAQFCSVSIGIAVGPRPTADELLRDADLAMYQAKDAGKDRYVVFDQSMQTASADRIALDTDLRDALPNHELYLLYQPTFNLQTQAVTGVEALIRWAHPERGVLGPDMFIPLAEENAMIIPIGRWVLEQACRQVAVWRADGHRIGMAINVSARQLEGNEFVTEVSQALTDNGLPPETLTLEITETVLMRDATAAAARLKALKALGVRIAIDDFGTGYSSLAYLRQFPVDALKIDRSFITGISYSREASALMHTLIQLGKSLGLETLGEGIEDHAQLEQLKHEECDTGQGFLFARPLDVDTVTRFLGRDRVRV
jgi:diguanylate cyclase (GGDEF)-like protein